MSFFFYFSLLYFNASSLIIPQATYNEYTEPTPTSGLTQDQVAKTQKLCKYAVSALDYDDKNTAIDNLEKALRILKTGRE